MMDREEGHNLKPIPGAAFGLAGAGATALIIVLAAFSAPRPADALPTYAQQTKLACGRCHVSAAGGGALTGFGKAFAANGHKLPSKGAKPGKTNVRDAGLEPPAAPPATVPADGLRGTATLFFTTAPGVSNQSRSLNSP
jgi:hypothetical protein